jgi:hypothetical protein
MQAFILNARPKSLQTNKSALASINLPFQSTLCKFVHTMKVKHLFVHCILFKAITNSRIVSATSIFYSRSAGYAHWLCSYYGVCMASFRPLANVSDINQVCRPSARTIYSYIVIPTDVLLCSDTSCTNSFHLQCLNTYATDLTDSCSRAAEAAIPCSCKRQTSGRIPGWSEHVQPVRDKSLFWHNLWLECGRPKTGAVADCMRRTRAAYIIMLFVK